MLELKVLDTKPLIKLQNDIKRLDSKFKPYPEDYLHLTLLFMGKPQELYEEVKKYCLSYEIPFNFVFEEFLSIFIETLDRMESIFQNEQFRAKTVKLSVFGKGTTGRRPLVLEIALLDRHFNIFRKQFLEKLINMLKGFNINYPEDFINNYSLIFKNSLPEKYNPHITLGKTTCSDIHFILDEKISLELGDFYFRNVESHAI